jgi:hypothetical protein
LIGGKLLRAVAYITNDSNSFYPTSLIWHQAFHL